MIVGGCERDESESESGKCQLLLVVSTTGSEYSLAEQLMRERVCCFLHDHCTTLQ
jgi:hypothetical protein